MSTQLARLITTLTIVSALGAGSACSDAATTGAEAPATLEDIAIPEDFRFETNRTVALSVTASEQAVKTGAAVEIKRADGRRIFMGPIQANKPVALDVVLPTKDERVEVTLKSGGPDRTTMIAIDGGEGSATFE